MFVLLRRKSKQKIAYTLLYSHIFRYFNKTEGFRAKTMSISYVFIKKYGNFVCLLKRDEKESIPYETLSFCIDVENAIFS